MSKGNRSLCPNRFDTSGMFGEVYNSDPYNKCGPCYEFQQADRLVGGTASVAANEDRYNYGFRDQKSTQQNGPFDLQDVTGGNFALSRTMPGIDGTKTSIGDKNNYKIFNKKECFDGLTSRPDFTTSPASIQGGMSSMLEPINRYPPMVGKGKSCRGGSKFAKNSIVQPLNEFKDGVLYSITFGNAKPKESFCGCMPKKPTTLAGQVSGCIVLVIILWFVISAFIAGLLFGKASLCPGGIFTPAEFSGIDIISTSNNALGKVAGGNVSSGISGYFKTVGQVMVSPFVSLGRLLGGKRSCSKPKTFGGVMNMNMRPKPSHIVQHIEVPLSCKDSVL